MSKEKSEVKQWLEDEFNQYMKKNYPQLLIEITDEEENNLTLKVNDTAFNLDEDQITELSIILSDNLVDSELYRHNGIYKYMDYTYIVPIVSDKKSINLNRTKAEIEFIIDNEGISFNTSLKSDISLRLLFILIKNDYTLNIRNLHDEHSYQDFCDIFSINYIEFNFEKCNTVIKDEKISAITLSAIYYINTITQNLIVPYRLSKNKLLGYFDLKIIKKEEYIIKVPFTMYELEPIIYYLVGITHDDFRFKYLDLYHVLEFYFDRSALGNIRELLKDELRKPLLYFDESLTNELAKKLKDIVVGDKKKYREEETLTLVLKLAKITEIITELGTLDEKGLYVLELPEVKSGDKIFLEKLRMTYDKSKKEMKLGNDKTQEDQLIRKLQKRIYGIRNAIAHSKEEFEWRLKPNSKEILELEKYDLALISCISKNVLDYFKSNV